MNERFEELLGMLNRCGSRHTWFEIDCDDSELLLRGIIDLQSTIATQQATIDLLKADGERLAKQCDEAGNVIASVVGCCTYSSEEKAKTGAYGISHEAFTKIDGYIRNYELTETRPITLHNDLMQKLEKEG